MTRKSPDQHQAAATPIGFAMAAALMAFSFSPSAAFGGDHPTVIELFQSQGCSSCPPANANVIALSDRPNLLVLSFGVTYWDRLGWKDTFASPQFTDRQWDYARAFQRSQVFTPEVVVNGRADVVGRNRDELEALIKRAARPPGAPVVEVVAGTVTVGAAIGDSYKADVWLVRYDPNIVQVPIRRGENGGITLPHKNVVHELVKLGDWSGQQRSYKIPDTTHLELREAILVQDGPGGAILAAARE